MGKLKTEMLPRLLSRPRRSGVRVGRIVAIATDGRPRVEFSGNEFGPLAARVTASVKPEALQRALERGSEVLLAFGGRDADGPILFDVVRSRSRRSPKIPDQAPVPTAETPPPS
ncbi:MAG TPA: DUF6484 domain-containing protein, partial [Gemmataceae bacterium]